MTVQNYIQVDNAKVIDVNENKMIHCESENAGLDDRRNRDLAETNSARKIEVSNSILFVSVELNQANSTGVSMSSTNFFNITSILNHPSVIKAPLAQRWVLINLFNSAARESTINEDNYRLEIGEFMFSQRAFCKQINVTRNDLQRAITRFSMSHILYQDLDQRKTLISFTHSAIYGNTKEPGEPESEPTSEPTKKTEIITHNFSPRNQENVSQKVSQQNNELNNSESKVCVEQKNTCGPESEPTTQKNDLYQYTERMNECGISSEKKPGIEKKEIQAKIFFNRTTKYFQNIEPEDIESWKKIYPSIEIERQLLKMSQWLIDNPQRIGNRRFIMNWLDREHQNPKHYNKQKQVESEEEDPKIEFDRSIAEMNRRRGPEQLERYLRSTGTTMEQYQNQLRA